MVINNAAGIDSGGGRTVIGGYLNHSSIGSFVATTHTSIGSNVNRPGLLERLYPNEKITYDLTVTPSPNGVTSAASGTYEAGTVLVINATADLGYRFVGWTGEVRERNKTFEVVMDKDKTISAVFAIDDADADGDGFTNYDELVLQNGSIQY